MATRQTSSSGKPKSPRIQVVLPEDLCLRLTALAEQESRTVSNMAKVLITYPMMTVKVILAIHWQALKLWLKGTPVHDHPDKATVAVEKLQ